MSGDGKCGSEAGDATVKIRRVAGERASRYYWWPRQLIAHWNSETERPRRGTEAKAAWMAAPRLGYERTRARSAPAERAVLRDSDGRRRERE